MSNAISISKKKSNNISLLDKSNGTTSFPSGNLNFNSIFNNSLSPFSKTFPNVEKDLKHNWNAALINDIKVLNSSEQTSCDKSNENNEEEPFKPNKSNEKILIQEKKNNQNTRKKKDKITYENESVQRLFNNQSNKLKIKLNDLESISDIPNSDNLYESTSNESIKNLCNLVKTEVEDTEMVNEGGLSQFSSSTTKSSSENEMRGFSLLNHDINNKISNNKQFTQQCIDEKNSDTSISYNSQAQMNNDLITGIIKTTIDLKNTIGKSQKILENSTSPEKSRSIIHEIIEYTIKTDLIKNEENLNESKRKIKEKFSQKLSNSKEFSHNKIGTQDIIPLDATAPEANFSPTAVSLLATETSFGNGLVKPQILNFEIPFPRQYKNAAAAQEFLPQIRNKSKNMEHGSAEDLNEYSRKFPLIEEEERLNRFKDRGIMGRDMFFYEESSESKSSKNSSALGSGKAACYSGANTNTEKSIYFEDGIGSSNYSKFVDFSSQRISNHKRKRSVSSENEGHTAEFCFQHEPNERCTSNNWELVEEKNQAGTNGDYKDNLCYNMRDFGSCKYGENCQFKH
ncbi:zinc finger CCCH domain-containing protein ASCRUDRAFT_76163 [Ascoidea rubescens DSM 1968]|uniref:C3H1-type domain-containing protein n=1 Tax=Ascoidea rubescens DSM 1968 TaxID=1344418 RepID=A0A1D2VGX7_9ASCO|nr:hypothetical protein ASCRUDRAFT_76163 [Ascoidea rubescens DSM 1968]ODV60800.1 hypothetical protein ASCRUDRAFT_76163 [Ascoidea rubescens DSM 1968]